ncbi:GlsB/YeaQ/YmgE family stress response membrane protein [Xanthobacter autotrophicus]|uniref:GlsB/YeaQ/YmgE family stress response membrane protein n=1 Tax=Xanthobacter autotrophicus TaxID=280 RepID=UPI00372BC6B4
MQDAQIGWIAAIIIGGFAGWIASSYMKSDTGIFMNILLGIIGAAIASFLFGLLGVNFGGWLGYLIAGVVGACILIGGARAIRR